LLLHRSFTNEDSKRSALLHHHSVAVDGLRSDNDVAVPPFRYIHPNGCGASCPRRNAAGKVGKVVSDLGALRMEPLRVGGERWGIRRTREASTSSSAATSSAVTADCQGRAR